MNNRTGCSERAYLAEWLTGVAIGYAVVGCDAGLCFDAFLFEFVCARFDFCVEEGGELWLGVGRGIDDIVVA